MAEIIVVQRRKRCRWCEGRAVRVAVNWKGHAIVTTNSPAAWKRLLADGWRRARVLQVRCCAGCLCGKKEHREITFVSPTRPWIAGAILEEYLLHPVCATNHHQDLMNGF